MPVRNRRQGREAALRALYQMSVGNTWMGAALDSITQYGDVAEDSLEFGKTLVRGVVQNIDRINAAIEAKAVGWTLERMAPIDRILLHIATFELFFCPEIPPAVSINEAVELAKKYSTAESGKFVNGVLGGILKDSPKANWNRETAPPEETWEEAAPAEVLDVVEETVEADSEEAQELAKVGLWKLRSDTNPE